MTADWAWRPAPGAAALLRGGASDGLVKAVACFAGDGAGFVGWESGALRAYRSSGELERTLLGHDGACLCLLIHGGALISGGFDRRVKLWSLAPGRGTPGGWGTWLRDIRGHHAAVKQLCPGGVGRVWSLSEDRTLRCWRMSDGVMVLLIRAAEHLMLTAGVSLGVPHAYAAVAESAVISVYRAADGARTTQLVGHAGVVWAVLVRGERVYSGAEDGCVRAWNPRSGACTLAMRGHSRRVTQLALSHDGGRLYSGAGDGCVRAWCTTSGECQLIMMAQGAVRALALSHDGALLFAGGGADGVTRQWATADGALLREHAGHADDVHVLSLSPATGQLWTGSYDGDARGWLVQPPAQWRRGNNHLWPVAFRDAARALLLAVHTRRDGCAANVLVTLGAATCDGLLDAILRALAATVERLPA